MVRLKDFDQIEQDALKRNIPIMQKEGILFLISQLNEIKATSCLEIGSAIGYSSMMMVTHVDDLKIDTIELNEAIYLAIALSIDSFCVGISSASFGLFGLLYPFLVPVFQLFLLNFGIILGKKITKIHFLNYIPLKFWNMISGILLIAIGIIRIFI